MLTPWLTRIDTRLREATSAPFDAQHSSIVMLNRKLILFSVSIFQFVLLNSYNFTPLCVYFTDENLSTVQIYPSALSIPYWWEAHHSADTFSVHLERSRLTQVQYSTKAVCETVRLTSRYFYYASTSNGSYDYSSLLLLSSHFWRRSCAPKSQSNSHRLRLSLSEVSWIQKDSLSWMAGGGWRWQITPLKLYIYIYIYINRYIYILSFFD